MIRSPYNQQNYSAITGSSDLCRGEYRTTLFWDLHCFDRPSSLMFHPKLGLWDYFVDTKGINFFGFFSDSFCTFSHQFMTSACLKGGDFQFV